MNFQKYIAPCALAKELRKHLLPGNIVSFGFIPCDSNALVYVRGTIPLEHDGYLTSATAQCTFFIPENWHFLAPEVRSCERFIRREIDWHVYSNPLIEGRLEWSSLCWVIPPQWRDSIKDLGGFDLKIRATWAAEFMTRNVKALLYRHFLGNQLGLEKWQWPDWSHGRRGMHEYEEFKSKRPL